MSTDAGLSPLRLQIEPGVLAVFNQRLVVICSPIRSRRPGCAFHAESAVFKISSLQFNGLDGRANTTFLLV